VYISETLHPPTVDVYTPSVGVFQEEVRLMALNPGAPRLDQTPLQVKAHGSLGAEAVPGRLEGAPMERHPLHPSPSGGPVDETVHLDYLRVRGAEKGDPLEADVLGVLDVEGAPKTGSPEGAEGETAHANEGEGEVVNSTGGDEGPLNPVASFLETNFNGHLPTRGLVGLHTLDGCVDGLEVLGGDEDVGGLFFDAAHGPRKEFAGGGDFPQTPLKVSLPQRLGEETLQTDPLEDLHPHLEGKHRVFFVPLFINEVYKRIPVFKPPKYSNSFPPIFPFSNSTPHLSKSPPFPTHTLKL
jgi:hypothetical protein